MRIFQITFAARCNIVMYSFLQNSICTENASVFIRAIFCAFILLKLRCCFSVCFLKRDYVLNFLQPQPLFAYKYYVPVHISEGGTNLGNTYTVNKPNLSLLSNIGIQFFATNIFDRKSFLKMESGTSTYSNLSHYIRVITHTCRNNLTQ